MSYFYLIALVAVFGTIMLLALVLFYFSWFQGDKWQQRYAEQVNNWPEGFPFKRLNQRLSEWSGWIWLWRISTSLFLLFALCISGIFIPLSLIPLISDAMGK